MEDKQNNSEQDMLNEPRLLKIIKSLCKINIIKLENSSTTLSGFLFKFPIEQELFYCLVFDEDIISNHKIKNNDIINISYDNELKNLNIKLDAKKRYINNFSDIGFNISIVEILDEDKISNEYFLSLGFEKYIYNRLIDADIYILKYTKEKRKIVKGKIKENNDNKEFSYFSDEITQARCPIIIANSLLLLFGISKELNNDKKENYGQFIYPVIDILKKDITKRRNTGIYENGKYFWEDGKYYEGEFKNNLPNGKGIKYYVNGNILYEGEFIKGKFEGNGKYINREQEYHIGQYKNGLANGKGKIYYKNGNIKFEGEFINGYPIGKGKCFYENNDYYIGEFKDGFINGKGIEYYSHGEIKYEGD